MSTIKYLNTKTLKSLLVLSMLMLAFQVGNAQTVTIGGNQYAFQWSGDPDIGLFFSSTNSRYELRDQAGNAEMWVNPIDGISYFRNRVGINTTVPSTQLSVRGQMSMSTIGFSTSQQDKISLYGNRLGDDNMAGFGFETETIISGGGLIENQPVLYSKAHHSHRWYIDNNADGGASASMVLEPTQLGVFTSDPLANLHVEGGNVESQILVAPSTTTSGGNAELQLAEDDDFTYGMKLRYDGSDNKFYFQGKNFSGLTVPHMSIERDNGDVAIGYGTNSVPAGYKLAVDGGIICEEVNVQLSSSWPDYVFEADYNLMDIRDVAKSIEANGHLPGIPSAAEMQASGLDLADMQTRMMEKIEELTLYIITLQEQIDELQTEVE